MATIPREVRVGEEILAKVFELLELQEAQGTSVVSAAFNLQALAGAIDSIAPLLVVSGYAVTKSTVQVAVEKATNEIAQDIVMKESSAPLYELQN